jgi:peptidyl-prolyl cis-trans isomerase B (cyclophilin B)
MKKHYSLSLAAFFIFFVATAQGPFTGKPMYNIEIKRGGQLLGAFKVELFPAIAPKHVRNFDSLVNTQFYDTTAFHRVIPGFMIQGGDPNSRHGNPSTWGMGQPGQPTVPAEFTAAKHLRGTLSAARSSNINSATSQFFVCVAAAPSLNNNYSVYGRVIDGMNWVDTIVGAPRNTLDRPLVKHEMFVTAIGSNDTIPVAPALNAPANGTTAVNYMTPLLLKWNAVRDAVLYQVEVAEDAGFTQLLPVSETSNLSVYISTGLQPGNLYYWRVRANNGGHLSDWSPTWTFDTSLDLVGLSSETQPSSAVRVFPNPGSGRFLMQNLEKGSRVEVYDVSGKLVYQEVSAGAEVLIDLEGRAKGVYSYTVSGEKVVRGRLILK